MANSTYFSWKCLTRLSGKQLAAIAEVSFFVGQCDILTQMEKFHFSVNVGELHIAANSKYQLLQWLNRKMYQFLSLYPQK